MFILISQEVNKLVHYLLKAANTVAGDISGYYTKEVRLAGQKMDWAMGLNISNIGAKVSYTETVDKDFIPTNLRLGSSLATYIDEYNQLAFEFNIKQTISSYTSNLQRRW